MDDVPLTDRLRPADVAKQCLVSPLIAREWIVTGIRLPDGKRVRLKAERVGGRWWVTPADLSAFRTRCTRGALPPDDETETAGHPVPSKSDRRHQAALHARLRAKGILA